MMQTLDLRNEQPNRADLARLVPRAASDAAQVTDAVARLLAAVRAEGEQALLDQAERFDGIRPKRIRMLPEDFERALRELDPAVRAALEVAIERVTRATEAQVPQPVVTD